MSKQDNSRVRHHRGMRQQTISKETLDHLLTDAVVDHICLFEEDGGMQIWFRSGSFIAIYAKDGLLDINVYGPDPPESEQLKDEWESWGGWSECD